MGADRLKSVFLATDEPKFEEALKSRFKDINFITYNRGGSVAPGVPRHFSNMRGEDKAIEAIVNIILLSKCKTLIRTRSYLSAISIILNPSIDVFTFGSTNSPVFPENVIDKM